LKDWRRVVTLLVAAVLLACSVMVLICPRITG
jgi:hypothetical protein